MIFFKSTKKLITNIYPEYNSSKHIKSEEQNSYSNLKKEINFRQLFEMYDVLGENPAVDKMR